MKNLYKIENELYIVDDTEEINKDTKTCWCIDISCNELVLHQGVLPSYHYKHYKKIIMTTDKSINVLCSCGKDCGAKESGVQAIDDDFLEWFVQNPSCEKVEVIPLRKSSGWYDEKDVWHWDFLGYKIIIPKPAEALELNSNIGNFGRPKQETLEEAAVNCWAEGAWDNRDDFTDGFVEGAKWQAERMYSEEEVESIWKFALYSAEQHDKFGTENKSYFIRKDVEEFIEQFKKK